ncbi:MAG: SurA N-terminal domain-containing protein [Bacteroidales bacterium]|jgi:peptidyl-prolyl cis-trans isomerase D|nr:SurA N-terminal domain-containing protein [Bacteroidales bacterium]
MATLEKIRNRAGVLVAVVIGMALLAFILGDFLNSGGALFSNTQFEIAEISGKSIPYQKYQKELNDIIEINKFSTGKSTLDEATVQDIQAQTWDQLVRQYVLEDEYAEIGLDISSQELWDMVQGENIHPIIQNLFTNPETGELNTMQVIRFLKTYDQDPTGQQKTYWLFVEDQMIQERMFAKYTNLISKGLYSTKAEALNELNNNSKKVDFEFVSQNINTVADSLISIKNGDLKNYFDNHKNEYKQEASRNMEYVTFDVIASEADKIAAEEWINNIKGDFANTETDKEFASINSEISSGNNYYKKDELPEELKDIMFDAEEGFMYGPYFNDEAYLLAKLSEIKFIPDSVKARHILLQPTQNQDANQVFAIADSIKNLLENGANFTSLSAEFSTDKAANEKGGDLGWFRANQMESPFSDTCFVANTGEYKLVATQFGLHIVQVTDKASNEKKVMISILGRKLEPSSETYQKTYAEASKFAGNNQTYEEFLQGIEKEGLTKKIASNVKEADQQLAGLEYPRELIRSIYDTDKHDIIKSQNNPIFELGNRFVIGFVSDVKEDGFATMEQVNSQLMVQVKKLKKAEYLADKFTEVLQENNDLNFIASKFNTEVYDATDISFRSYSIPNAGVEPKLVAVATSVDADQITAPIKGDNNVFVIRVNNISTDENVNADLQQKQSIIQYQNRSNYEAFEALKETSNIVDKRSKFY